MTRRARCWIACLLSIALSGQSFAVASLRLCHNMADGNGLALSSATTSIDHTHRNAERSVQRQSMHQHAQNNDQSQQHEGATKTDRVKCAACAGSCHSTPLAVVLLTHIPHFDAVVATFPPLDLPRFRDSVDGLERPPRT
jgi:hypothetical protein